MTRLRIVELEEAGWSVRRRTKWTKLAAGSEFRFRGTGHTGEFKGAAVEGGTWLVCHFGLVVDLI